MKKFFLILFLILGFALPAFCTQGEEILKSQVGKVLSVENLIENILPQSGGIKQIKQSVEVEVLTGEKKGDKIIVDNMLMGNPAYDINLKNGDRVILHAEKAQGGINFFIADKQRVNTLYFLSGLFCLLVLIVGKKRGLFSLLSIFFTLGLVFWALTPLILSGMNPILATVLVCIISTIGTMYLVGGLNYKSTSAILGTGLSLVFAGLMSLIVIKTASLTGFSSEESLFLFTAHPNLNFTGVLASAMIIGALGALMDIGMSIASTVNELFENNRTMSVRDLFDSGMNVGRDIIGTMANTLILVYLGGSLSLVLLSNNIDLQKFFNLNQVATEISAALIGSIALVLCVPATALIASFLVRKTKQKEVAQNSFDDII
ncbi:MAG TPA: YibE/F family protein [Candidatus Gastranaerophilaceae bacterium]|nr:YibE/F family protein [Candidatus Gastranaerophilaceae bacterium]